VELLNAIIDAIPIIIQALVPQIPEIVNTIIDTLLNNLPILLDAAVELFMALVKAIPKVVKSLAKELPTIINTVMKVLGTLGTKVLSVGKDLVTGLWKGVKDKLSWLKDKLSGFASSVLDGIKSFFGIKSPSREMAWVGDMLDQGLAKGVEDSANDPIKAMQRVSSGVLDAAAGDVGGIGFERQLHRTGSAAVAAAGGLGDTSALLAKLDGIYERLGRLQVVMNGRTVVGEIVDEMDAALGTRRALTARGV
jgi:phage-related protein